MIRMTRQRRHVSMHRSAERSAQTSLPGHDRLLEALKRFPSPMATIDAYDVEPDEPTVFLDLIEPRIRELVARNVASWEFRVMAEQDTCSIEKKLAVIMEKGISEEPYDPTTYRYLYDLLMEWAPEVDKWNFQPELYDIPAAALKSEWFEDSSMEPTVACLYQAAWRGAVVALRAILAQRRIS